MSKATNVTPCKRDGCDRPSHTKGFCHRDYVRLWRHGDPERVLRGGPEPSYSAAHSRVKAVLGSARDRQCVDCGKPAQHWSYDHADPDEFVGPLYRKSRTITTYSVKPEHYAARCIKCHSRFDAKYVVLTGEQESEIIRLYVAGEHTQQQLADQFGVSRSKISHITQSRFDRAVA